MAVIASGLMAGIALNLCLLRTASGRERMLVEAGAGLGSLWIFLVKGAGVESILMAVCAAALSALSLVDLKSFEIPPLCNLIIAAAGAVNMLMHRERWYVYLIGMVLVSGIFLAVYFATGGRGIGGGDIKLMAAAGLLLGWQKVLLALFIASVSGSVLHITLMYLKDKERVLAFGPYLSLGIFFSMLYGEIIIDWYYRMFFAL